MGYSWDMREKGKTMMVKEVKAIAKKSGATVDEIVEEMEAGFDPSKPFSVVIKYDRLDGLRRLAEQLEHAGLGIFRADGLDREWGGVARGNSFVIRSLSATGGKPDEWRVI